MSKSQPEKAYWCDRCQVPVLGDRCLACGGKTRSISSTAFVPVFRPELNYLKKQNGVLFDPPPPRELETWVAHPNHTYYLNGNRSLKISGNGDISFFMKNNGAKHPRRSQKELLSDIKKANSTYVQELQYEAENFIRDTINKFKERPILVSFSGGKDSTVVSHLVMTALGRSDILHIFADTTIEFPDTYKYIQEFQKKHPVTPFIVSRSLLDFFDTAEKIGPPSRILRWCCTTHKTNPLAKLIQGISPGSGVLTFDGIRGAESSRRAKYPRISSQHKIANEILARPILYWTDFELWIFILYHGLQFNDAYRKGFRRVGCLYCPLNSDWSQQLIKSRYPKEENRWACFLAKTAKSMRHSNPDVFVSNGWRTRAGGNGLNYYKTAIESAPCLLSEHAFSYQILSGNIRHLKHFVRPLGPQTQISSNGCSESFLIHDSNSNEILASVEIAFQDSAVRINYLIEKNRRLFQQRVEKQLRKLQSCILCGACGVKCPVGALKIEDTFHIDSERCVSCLACVKHNCTAVKSLHYDGKKNGRV